MLVDLTAVIFDVHHSHNIHMTKKAKKNYLDKSCANKCHLERFLQKERPEKDESNFKL